MALVGNNYSYVTTDNLNFTINFEIPINCDWAQTFAAAKYTITVQLKKGQTVPSPTFTNCTSTAVAIAGTLDLEFNQLLNGVSTVRPKVSALCC